MAGGGLSQLTAQSLSPGTSLNWVFLVELLVCGILALFFLFYFNRLFATLISYGVRAYTWHKYRAYIDVQSIQISFLGGRLFFKGVRYHGVNETIVVHDGYITWRYWLRRVKDADIKHGDKASYTSSIGSEPGEGQDAPLGRRTSNVGERGGLAGASNLPCRIEATVRGLEWFVYNRSPAYDAILSGIHSESQAQDAGEDADRSLNTSDLDEERSQSDADSDTEKVDETQRNSSKSTAPRSSAKAKTLHKNRGSGPGDGGTFQRGAMHPLSTTSTSIKQQKSPSIASHDQRSASFPRFLDILPIRIECQKGAIVLGNANTRVILTTKFENAFGEINAGSAGILDSYKQLFHFQIEGPVVQMKPNVDFKEPQMEAGKAQSSGREGPLLVPSSKHTVQYLHHWRRKAWRNILYITPYFRTSVKSFHAVNTVDGQEQKVRGKNPALNSDTPWMGLSRYLEDDEQDIHNIWGTVDYARSSTLVDCPKVQVTFYWDVPGVVTDGATLGANEKDINGDEAPEYGMELSVYGGTIVYGPWADKQRADIQNVFFPNAFKDAIPATRLLPGMPRVSTHFKLHIEIEEETTLIIPTREHSKDWQWRKRADAVKNAAASKKHKSKKRGGKGSKGDNSTPGPDVRPYGWISLSVAANSTVNYGMDMFAGQSGYCNNLELDLSSTQMTSSVNHGLLFRSGRQAVLCDLSNPRGWNETHEWAFSIRSQDLELFLLRDHMFLITDLVNDFTIGPPPDFHTFVPFKYRINLEFSDWKLYLNANDSNIINNPSDIEDNTFLILCGTALTATLSIPLLNLRPRQNAITFETDLSDTRLQLSVPPWNTQATFLNTWTMATLHHLTLDGSYSYCAETSPSLTDTLILNLHGRTFVLHVFGFLIRYFMKVQENYFGKDLHFKTLEEFQKSKVGPEGVEIDSEKQHQDVNSNDLDVILGVKADKITGLMPANLYSSKDNVKLDVNSATVDLRFSNYYMDMEACFSPLEASLQGVSSSPFPEGDYEATSSTQLFINGFQISGHRLFGLPPTEPTYVCNWDFEVGEVTGETLPIFVRTAMLAAKAFAFTFDDEENALPSFQDLALHDITFLRARVRPVRVWVRVDHTAFLVQASSLNVDFNDWAGSMFSERLRVLIPDLTIALIDGNNAVRSQQPAHAQAKTYANFRTTVDLRMVQKKAHFAKERRLQQEHVRFHDQRTARTPFLLYDRSSVPLQSRETHRAKVNPPAMPFPHLPDPVVQITATLSGSPSESMRSAGRSILSSKRSFLSEVSLTSKPSSLVRHREVRRFSTSSKHSTPGMRRVVSSQKSGSHSGAPSFSNATRNLDKLANDKAASVMRFSSDWSCPYFPLATTQPDDSDVPGLYLNNVVPPSQEGDDFPAMNFDMSEVDPSTLTTSFIINMNEGLKGFFTPQCLFSVASLLEQLSPTHPVDVLDTLQFDVLTSIVNAGKRTPLVGEVTDVAIRIPCASIRFINPFGTRHNPESSQAKVGEDEYNITVTRTVVTGRSVQIAKEVDQIAKDNYVLHADIGEIALSAKERMSGTARAAASVNVSVQELVLWLVSKEDVVVDLRFKGIQSASSSRKLEYLASLIHRSTVLGEDIASRFETVAKQNTDYLRYLVYALTVESSSIPDPAFLIKPSYVLRIAGNHLRTNDSWKIMSRLRHIYNSLSEQRRDTIAKACHSNLYKCPRNGRDLVVSTFDQWRSWDLAHVHRSSIMTSIWGPTTLVDGEDQRSNRTPVTLKVATEGIRILLDPGPRQSELAIKDVTATFSQSTTEAKTSLKDASSPQDVALLQIYFSSIALRINWEIYELVEDILNLYQNSETSTEEPVTMAALQTTESKRTLQLHVVIGTDLATISIDSMNLQCILLGKNLRGSVIHKESLTAVISAEASSSEVLSRSAVLAITTLRQSSIYIGRNSIVNPDSNVFDWKLAASCRRITVDIPMDILGILEVSELLIRDEVSYINGLIRRTKSSADRKISAPRTEKSKILTKPTNMITVALFLDEYSISLALIPALAYVFSGEVARSTLRPSKPSGWIVDFDLKSHKHSFNSTSNTGSGGIIALPMPSINGRVSIETGSESKTVHLSASAEKIKLEAGAVHSLLSTLLQPEIRTATEDISSAFQDVQSSLNRIPGFKQQTTTGTGESNPLFYRANLTMAGLNIRASAPGMQKDHFAAEVQFDLGLVEANLNNRLAIDGPILEYPEVKIKFHQFSLEVRRRPKHDSFVKCGNVLLQAVLTCTSKLNRLGNTVRSYHIASDGLEVNLRAETASVIVDVVAHLEKRIKSLDLKSHTKPLQTLRRLTKPQVTIVNAAKGNEYEEMEDDDSSVDLFSSMYSLELTRLRVSWIVLDSAPGRPERGPEDLVLSIQKIDFATTQENAAQLSIESFLLQMVPALTNKDERSANSALLPEVVFKVAHYSTKKERRLALQAAGKSLDLRLTSEFIRPANALHSSIASASRNLGQATAARASTPTDSTLPKRNLLGDKKLTSLLVDADFAGAIVSLIGRKMAEPKPSTLFPQSARAAQPGRYGQFGNEETGSSATLRAPGIAFKIGYRDSGDTDPSLNVEIKVDASTNVLYPKVVPLILEISSSIKEAVGESEKPSLPAPVKQPPQSLIDNEGLRSGDPSAILGRCQLNLGIKICQQEFSLSCQPIARVAATGRVDDIYITINTINPAEQRRFFAMSVAFSKVEASVQHVYSRESTASFDVDSIVVSLMNSRHVSTKRGLSAMLKISPMKTIINAKQLQDFLLFREIWYPPEIRPAEQAKPSSPPPGSQPFVVQRYQQVASAGAFPWNATVAVEFINIQLDLGPSLGKSDFIIDNFWASSKKSSDWEQNLCVGFDKIGIISSGRMSGLVELQQLKVRTSIQWPLKEKPSTQTPLIQASVSFHQLLLKASFDYQAFLVADITSFAFLMYNVREESGGNDRLVAILDGDKVQVFCTTSTASQGLALYQAFLRLAQDKRAAYEASLRDIEKYMRRKSVLDPQQVSARARKGEDTVVKAKDLPLSLQTDVVMTLKAVNIGAFPATFYDSQIFKVEALNAQARFSVALQDDRTHSGLGLTLGQLRVALSSVHQPKLPKRIEDMSVTDVVESATAAQGGTILRVPKVVMTMQTWQSPSSNDISYIFKSSFEGKVDVGWNYSRISFIRGMWMNHSKALAHRLGKPIAQSAVQITGVPQPSDHPGGEPDGKRKDQEKITAVVNVPQSKYEYIALEPPIIETPQLRDMGEATPPLEWIGLHRERLPNLTHQIIIVTLLEVAKEVEDAYEKILGSF